LEEPVSFVVFKQDSRFFTIFLFKHASETPKDSKLLEWIYILLKLSYNFRVLSWYYVVQMGLADSLRLSGKLCMYVVESSDVTQIEVCHSSTHRLVFSLNWPKFI